jgi:hypothetical protein
MIFRSMLRALVMLFDELFSCVNMVPKAFKNLPSPLLRRGGGKGSVVASNTTVSYARISVLDLRFNKGEVSGEGLAFAVGATSPPSRVAF